MMYGKGNFSLSAQGAPETSVGETQTSLSVKEIAIQANDFDIERKQSYLPSRRRFIPLKFSDYRIMAEEDDNEEEDGNFQPDQSASKEKGVKFMTKRGRGRPKKSHPAGKDDLKSDVTGTTPETANPPKLAVTRVPSGYKCGVCGRIFSLRGNAKAHLITHTNERPYPCDFDGCGKRFRTKESLRKHQLSHLGIKMFECSECHQKFCSNASLREHMARHTGDKPLTCELCGRKFRQVCVLKRHLTTHSEERPFKCTICGRGFVIKLYLKSHMKSHTGEKPFSCNICHKKFAHASDVNRHKVTHSGEKRYPCSVCGKRYGDASSRKRHEKKTHEGPQIPCPLCPEMFPRPRHLRTHLFRQHNTQEGITYEVRVVPHPPMQPQGAMISLINEGPVGEGINESNAESSSNTSQDRCNFHTMDDNTGFSAQSNSHVKDGSGMDTSAAQRGSDHDEASFVEVELPAGRTEIMEDELSTGSTQIKTESCTEPSEVGKEEVLDLAQSTELTAIIQGSMQPEEGKHTIPQDSGSQPDWTYTIVSPDILHLEQGAKPSELPVTLVQGENTFTVVQGVPLLEAMDSSHHINPGEPGASNIQLDSDSSTRPSELAQIPGVSDPYDIRIILTEDDRADGGTSTLMAVSDQGGVNAHESTALSMSHYVYQPDFASQEYYNWLSAFAEECKLSTVPFPRDQFTRISHVQKTLSDFMASPSGVICDRANFKVLMTITHDLSEVINKHLAFMFNSLG